MRISPSVMSSSPATIRSTVVLPQPDGPTSTMNVPSGISRSKSLTASVPSAKTFRTLSRTISATCSRNLPAQEALNAPLRQIRRHVVRGVAAPEGVQELAEVESRLVAEDAPRLVDRPDPALPEELVEPEAVLPHELRRSRPVPLEYPERFGRERPRVIRAEGRVRHDVERVEAAFRLVPEGENDRLRHVTLVDAAEEQAKAVALERFRDIHPEAQRNRRHLA